MSILKVGKTLIQKGSRTRKLSYRDVIFDYDGWADASQYLPEDFDLVKVKINGKKSRSGWSIGNTWDGLHLEEDCKVLYWRRMSDR